jgi:hypothetical protein
MAKQKSEEYKYTDEYKKKVLTGQKKWRDNLHGEEKLHIKTCENENCQKLFEWFGRENTSKFKVARFCSSFCSHQRTGFWNSKIKNYRVICFKYHEKRCIICGFDKIVETHHYDRNKENNRPLNLIPLCPNHHQMFHSNEYHDEVDVVIKQWIEDNKEKFRDEDGG